MFEALVCQKLFFSFVSDPLPDYIKAAVETVVEIHKKEPPGDILVFLTGQEEVKTAVELLTDWADSLKRSYGNFVFEVSPCHFGDQKALS